MVRHQEESRGKIFYLDIGDDLTTQEKLSKLKALTGVGQISELGLSQKIRPDEDHDWLDQREKGLDKHLIIGDKKDKSGRPIFSNYS
jgi:predicted helicase